MSGGRWGYQQYHIEEQAEWLPELLKAVAQTEHIVDWAESGDTVRRREDGTGAEQDLYELWLETFTRLFDGTA